MERRRKKKSKEKLFFEELCNKYYIKILRYCNAHLGYKHEDLAEECAQDTFLTALQNINKLKVHPNVCGWLYKTAENYNKKSLQKMKREKEKHVSIDINVENELAITNNLEYLLEENIDIDEIKSLILSELNEDEYKLYMDYCDNKMGLLHIMKENNISESAAKSRIFRLRRKLKTLIRKNFE